MDKILNLIVTSYFIFNNKTFIIMSCYNGLQIAEVVNSMKDLIDFSRENKIGAIGNSLAFFFVSHYHLNFVVL